MSQFLTIIEIIVSVMLLFCILLQHRASGLSATFGGSGAVPVQRRGAERVIFRAAIILSFFFLLIPVLQWYVL
ncbi:preprotein translocase subunit SecG [Patescibacteria group bacterium]|nr:preprotein translocase subunit SecG [Patescibacteria group bacterium]MBU2260103.1 preprotein translocase subunit SecG [Patescibacteria group bacterium]